MYEPDSPSFSVVSSTSRSPQQPSHQQHQGAEANGYDGITSNGHGNGQGSQSSQLLTGDQTQVAMEMELHKKQEASAGAVVSSEKTPSGAGAGVAVGVASSTQDAHTTTVGANGSAATATGVPLQDQPEQSSNLSSTQNVISPTKSRPAKLCQVCGDKAKSFHFGGLSCDSCKAFFRRAVHNDAYKGFQCVYGQACEITMSNRKSCQSCRFKKCLSIGMEINWVMTEEERNQLQKQRNEKASGKAGTNTSPSKTPAAAAASGETGTMDADADLDFEPNVADMLKYMTAAERDEIESIVNKYQHSYREIPFRVSHSSGQRKTVEIIQMFTTILRRFAYFTKLIPEFAALPHADQSTLLRAGVLEMCLLRSALAFDTKNNRWPKTENMEFLRDCPQLRVEDMEKLVSRDLYHMHMQFINGIQELRVDEPTVMILLLIVLFYPERGPLESLEEITAAQEKYLLLLDKYVQWRFGPRAGKVFPKLLTRLADLRQLNDFHTEYNLKMTKTEVEEIQEQLGNINLNPYPQWELVKDAAAAHSGDGSGAEANAYAKKHSAHAYADVDVESSMRGTPASVGVGETASPTPVGFQQDVEMHHHPELPAWPTATPTRAPGAMQMQMPYAANAGAAPPQFPPAAAAAGVGMLPSMVPGQMPMRMPDMRQLFMQFVSQRIPTLITNPFATFPMENEMAGAAAFFEQMSGGAGGGMSAASMAHIQSMMAGAGGGGGMGHGQEAAAAAAQQQQHMMMMHGQGPAMTHPPPQMMHHAAGPQGPPVAPGSEPSQPQISQICNILESSDPDTLRQLKESLSPDMVAKLSSIFGGGGGSGGGGSGGGGSSAAAAAAEFFGSGGGSFDLSKIPPELISSFLGGGLSPTSGPAGPAAPGLDPGLSGYQHQYFTHDGPTSYGGGLAGYQQHETYHGHPQQQHAQHLDSAGNWPEHSAHAHGHGHGHEQGHILQHQDALDSGVDFNSAAFLTHRQQQQLPLHPQHFDQNPHTHGPSSGDAAANARYANGSAGGSQW